MRRVARPPKTTVSSRGRWAVLLGLLSSAALPVAIAVTLYVRSLDLLQAGFAVPAALALGAGAVALAQRERRRLRARVASGGGLAAARAGRLLGILGLSIASAGVVALAVYALLAYLGSR